MKKSISDRLSENALSALPGPLARLEYMAKLRNADGQYSHWGLSKMYGEADVSRDIAETHQSVLSEVLSAPFPDLEQELQMKDSGALHMRSLSTNLALLMPPLPSDGCKQHLQLVLFVLSCLAQRPRSHTGPAAY
jgi:hypothetical protein